MGPMQQSTRPTDLVTDTTYRWSPITPHDVTRWADLVNHLAEVDGTEEFYPEESLREDLGRTNVDPERDTLAAWDGEEMVGFAQVTVPRTTDHEGTARAYIGGGVRESHRGRGLGRQLMDATEPRALELLRERHPDAPRAYLGSGGGLEGSSAERMLSARGYVIVRYYNELTRPLGEPVDVPDVEGVELRSPVEADEEPTRLAHNDSFRDHWGSGPIAAQSWHEHWTGSAGRPGVSTVAVRAGSGEVLAYVMCSEYVDRHLYVDILGTVRGERGRGLAEAALLRTIEAARSSGDYDVIELGVDSENPTGATRLYERVGFVHHLRTTSMRRMVS